MRKVYESKCTEVICRDLPGAGNACHEYDILSAKEGENIPQAIFTKIKFQKGPIKEFGINGCQNEDLISVVIDRLEGFQAGEFATHDNQVALDCLRIAQSSLQNRTKQREIRGVEGTNVK